MSGTATFDRVPLNPATNGLNYLSTRQDPIRGVVVEAVDAANTVLDTDITDLAGRYSVDVPDNTDVRIRVRAQLLQTVGNTYNIQVLDNTSGNAPYILAGTLANSGTAASVRNLNAPSGWDGTQYASTRAAGPFAMLDTIFEGIIDLTAVDSTITFPDLRVLWSVNNRPADGDIADGDVGTSFFSSSLDGEPSIVILGEANNDTDEYDTHVVMHEFGHYTEAFFSRVDSVGGSHNAAARLDPRVALSEGFGNAFSGIILDDPTYRDSSGNSQATGFRIENESNNFNPEGWFNEGSVGSIIYDVFDSTNEGPDTLSVGLGPIYRALTSTAYTDAPEPTTIFLLAEALRAQPEISNAALGALLGPQSITGTGPAGVGETNDGGIPTSLPFLNPISIGGAAVEVCSVDDDGVPNRLGNRGFLQFDVPVVQAVTIRADRSSGAASSDPDILLFDRGRPIARADSAANNTESLLVTLTAGSYIIEVAHAPNIGFGTPETDVCFNVTVQ